MNEPGRRLDRYTQIGELGGVVHQVLRTGLPLLALVIIALVSLLFVTDNIGWLSLLWLGAGLLSALSVWQSKGIGLPIIPMLAVQHFIAYGTPLWAGTETLDKYPTNYITSAGLEVCLFLVFLTAGWRLGMEIFRSRQSFSYVLQGFSSPDGRVRTGVGIILILVVTGYNLLESLQMVWIILDLLPSGTYSLVSAVIKAMTIAGYFIVAMAIGANEAKPSIKAFYWCTFVVNALIMASGFLLSSATNLVAAAVIGLFWSSGRLPWKLIVATLAILSFLHLGKFDMRERYWGDQDEGASFKPTLQQLPGYYQEWGDSSLRNILGSDNGDQAVFGPKKKESASMLGRVDNMQNMLFAINAVEGEHIPTLNGATYVLIPPLLIPRMLWPDKPRAHEGQVMLNVHFGRQVLSSTFTTYVAWGLLPEAYGNFGSIWGGLILGLFLGLVAALIETLTATKPLLSLEGLLTFALFVELTVSFEMSASVLVTALFQSAVIIAMACAPFVHRTLVVKPETTPAITS